MKQIADHVRDIIFSDVITLEYLHKGLLNTSAYAQSIIPEIESRSLLKPTLGSVVTALSRIKHDDIIEESLLQQFVIDNIEMKMPITELVFKKTGNTIQLLSNLYSKLSKKERATINIVNVEHELDIFAQSDLSDIILQHFGKKNCLEIQPNLAAIILEYDPHFRNYYGMAAQVLMTIANNRVNMLECATTYSEFIIYIDQSQANDCLEVIKNNYLVAPRNC
jgi:aspartokinase